MMMMQSLQGQHQTPSPHGQQHRRWSSGASAHENHQQLGSMTTMAGGAAIAAAAPAPPPPPLFSSRLSLPSSPHPSSSISSPSSSSALVFAGHSNNPQHPHHLLALQQTPHTTASYGHGQGHYRYHQRGRATFLLSEEEKEEIRTAFELFDTKKCGKVTYRELKLAMRALDFDVKKSEVKSLMEEHTKDGNTDEVDMDEFMEILSLKYKERDPNEELAKAFKIFDEDGTGRITLKNLRKISRELGEHISDEELGAMIEEFDDDQDGAINEVEFFNIMKKDELDD